MVSTTALIAAWTDIQWANPSFFIKMEDNHLLSSGLFSEDRQGDESSRPWLSSSKRTPSSAEQGRHTHSELHAGALGVK